MLFTLLTTSWSPAFASEIVEDPMPFLITGGTVSPIGAGHVSLEAGGAVTSILEAGGGAQAHLIVGLSDSVSLFASGVGTVVVGPPTYLRTRSITETGDVRLGVQHAVFDNGILRLGYYGSVGYGVPLVSTFTEPTLAVSAGLSMHARYQKFRFDLTIPLVAIPVTDLPAAEEESLVRFVDTRFSVTHHVNERTAIRLGRDVLPYVAFRKRITRGLWAEPSLGFLTAGVKLDARI